MNVRAPEASVAASSFALAVNGMSYDAVSSLVLGLAGVLLARIAFVSRENRQLGRAQTWRETAPLTLLAMLIAGPFIWEHHLGVTWAVVTGVGVGWSAILVVEIIGKQALKAVMAFLNMGPPAAPTIPSPPDATLARAYPVPEGEVPEAQKLLGQLPHADKA